MKKNIIGNVVTGDEKLFLEFILGKKKAGVENLLLENSVLTNPNNTNNLIKISYTVEDDYNEDIIKDNHPDRIGITLTNFMNKTDKLLPILNKYLKLIDNFDINKMEKLYAEIKVIIAEFKLTEIKNNYCINETLLEFYNMPENKDKLKYCKNLIEIVSKEENTDKEFLNILRFIESLFHLKNNYYSYDDLTWITLEIFEKQDNIQRNYNLILLDVIKKLEYQLNVSVNEVLKELVHQIFKNFYNDYRYASNSENLFEFLIKTKKNMENNPYNTYYKNIYEYISSIENKKISDIRKRFEKFSLYEMAKIFINTLIEDISYISNNYDNVPDVISNTIVISKNIYKYEISSFNELFYISRYYIKEDGYNLTKCNLCNRFFITQGKINEKHCRRTYKEDLNCCEYAIKYFRETKSFTAEISDIHNRIRSMLKKRDDTNNTNQFEIFDKKYKDIKNKIDLENINQDEKEKKLLNWIELEHNNLKNTKK